MTGVARRVGRAAAATLIAGTVGGIVLLAGEAVVARNRRYARPEFGLAIRTGFGPVGAPALRLVLLGDSSALGVGVDRVTQSVGGQLALLLSRGSGGVDGAGPAGPARQVQLSNVAVVGSRSSDLSTQVARALLGERPDVAVILVGAHDATDLRRPREAAAYLSVAVRRLREAGVGVVVGTCPDLGAVRAIAPPLRQVAGWLGRRTAQAQADAVRAAGGIAVDLGADTGPVFRADAGAFSFDGYHPSADGYRVWAHALLPAVTAAAAARQH